jgi:hypothetical protein
MADIYQQQCGEAKKNSSKNFEGLHGAARGFEIQKKQTSS